MIFRILPIFVLLIAFTQAGILLGKDGALKKIGDAIGIKNLVNVDADARVNLLGNEVGVDGAIGIGENGVGAHASADADILGQKAKIHADVLDGHQVDQHNHEVYTDSANRQYVLQRQYVGSKSVLVRKYLDNGQIYLAGANEDNEQQHAQIDDWRIYDRYGGWWDLKTRRYYNRLGQWVSDRVWNRALWDRDNQGRIYDSVGGWWDRLTGRYYSPAGQWVRERVMDPLKWKRYLERDYILEREPTGGWQRDGSYIAVDEPRRDRDQLTGGWQRDGSYIAVDEPRRDRNQPTGGWQRDGSYIAVDEPRRDRDQPTGGWQRDGSYIAVDELRSDRDQPTGGWQSDGSYISVDDPRTETRIIYEDHQQPSGSWVLRDQSYEPRRETILDRARDRVEQLSVPLIVRNN